MTQQGRKVRFEITPLEAEAIFALASESVNPEGKAWRKFERRRGAGVAKSALVRATDKIGKEIKRP